ncbi:MAG: hypothetical protein ACTH8B_14455, partial [Serratia proteamaculans]
INKPLILPLYSPSGQSAVTGKNGKLYAKSICKAGESVARVNLGGYSSALQMSLVGNQSNVLLQSGDLSRRVTQSLLSLTCQSLAPKLLPFTTSFPPAGSSYLAEVF